MINQQRYEIKFALNESEVTHALSWLANIDAKKKYPDRIVNSLYFDNLDQESIRDNLAGNTPRHKIRLRWYGDDEINILEPNLEIKTKNGRLGSKILYPLKINKKLIKTKSIYTISNDIFKEIYCSNFHHNAINEYLVHMLIVKYTREYFEKTNGIRITIDKKICFLNANQNVRMGYLKPSSYNFYVMEIKFSQELKQSVANLIRILQLTPKRFSKYLVGLAMFGYISYI